MDWGVRYASQSAQSLEWKVFYLAQLFVIFLRFFDTQRLMAVKYGIWVIWFFLREKKWYFFEPAIMFFIAYAYKIIEILD